MPEALTCARQAQGGGFVQDPPDYKAGGGGFRLSKSAQRGDGEPSREFASMASELLDEDLGEDEVRLLSRPYLPTLTSLKRHRKLHPYRSAGDSMWITQPENCNAADACLSAVPKRCALARLQATYYICSQAHTQLHLSYASPTCMLLAERARIIHPCDGQQHGCWHGAARACYARQRRDAGAATAHSSYCAKNLQAQAMALMKGVCANCRHRDSGRASEGTRILVQHITVIQNFMRKAIPVRDPSAAATRAQGGGSGGAGGQIVQVGGVRPEPAEPEREGEEEDDEGGQNQEYDYEHFWDLAAAEDAPSEDELEAALDKARKEFAEQVRLPSLVNPARMHSPGLS